MGEEAVRGLLGLAAKSGSLVAGAAKTVAEAAGNRIDLALLDESAADNTAKRVLAACSAGGIAVVPLRAELLGSSTGRPDMLIAGIRPDRIAEGLRRQLNSRSGD